MKAGPRLLAAAGAAGLLAAIALPGERPGLGVLLVMAAILTATHVTRGIAPGWPRAWALLAVACSAVALLRDAPWVVWPAILGALGLGSVAVAGGATWRSLLEGLVAGPASAPRGLAAVARAGAAGVPANAGSRAAPILRGAAIAAPLLVVFGALFATGDRAFAQLAEDSLPADVALGRLPVRVFAFALVAALVGGFVVAPRARGRARAARQRLRTVEWAIPLAALNLLFGFFVVVQFAVLFGGDGRVLDTAGLTYAEYAREGFGQLLIVAVLTLVVVGAALRWAAGDRRLLRVLLVTLCVLTGVVLASALHRLDLYQDAFGATRLRVTATATLLWLGAILALVVIALGVDRSRFLPRASLLVTALAGLSFALWNPELRIAERNLGRERVDRQYLRTLSADARPALPKELEQYRDADGWGGWNLARR